MAENTIQKVVAAGALGRLPTVLQTLGCTGAVLLIADNRTYQVAGVKVNEILTAQGYRVRLCILERNEPLVPDERALGEIMVALEPEDALLVAVGSGSVTDLTRYTAYRFGKPFVAVPTAPSMDGYASSVAPLTIRGFKKTFKAATPAAIIADTDVLRGAPQDMILAGLGDLLGKYTSLADWKLSSFINEEAYSEDIAAMVRTALTETVNHFDSRLTNATLIAHLTDALIVSGEAMQLWGDSRPASGAEHHLAHFWEMQAGLQGHQSYFHGTKVGIAVILVAEIYHRVFAMDAAAVERSISHCIPELNAEYTARIQSAYGPLASDVLYDLKEYYLDAALRKVRQRRIIANWEMMRAWVHENVPRPEWLRQFMLQAGAPVEPGRIGIDAALLGLSLENAMEVRGRYTVFRLAEDIGFG